MSGLKVRDLAYVRFSAPDLDVMERFLQDFGMQTAQRDAEVLYMRGGGIMPFVHVTHLGPPGFLGVAYDAGSTEALARFAAEQGVSVQPQSGPGGGQVVKLTDPDGFGVEVIAGWTPAEPLPKPARLAFNDMNGHFRHNELKRIGQGPSQVLRLGHCVLLVTDFRRSEAWYKERFGFITSDEIEAGPEQAIGAFMRCDRGDDPTDHHAMFLMGGQEKKAFHHAAFEVLDFDDLQRGHYHLRQQNYQREWGIGRHILGSQIFDYWMDPWGHGIEHWTDGDMMAASWGSRKSPMDELLGVQWGPTYAEAHPEGAA